MENRITLCEQEKFKNNFRWKRENFTCEKENYRPKEAAKYLGVGLSTVWLYIKQGKLKSKKLSDRVTIISKEELDAFIARNGVEVSA